MKSSAQLKDVTLKIGSGSTPRGGKGSYLSSGEINLIRSQNIYNHKFKRDGLAFISADQAEKLKNVEVFENDILINITGDSIARNLVVYSDMLPARVNQHVAIIRCDTAQLDPYYLSAILTSQKMQNYLISIGQVGATRAALTKKMLEDIEIPVCSIEMQREIGLLLKMLNEKIMLNIKIIETLEEIVASLFENWFVHFEFPDEDGNPYKSSGGKMVNSELGEIPEGWEIIDINDISLKISKGTTPTGEDLKSAIDKKKIYFIKVKDIQTDGCVKFNNVERIPESIHFNKLKRSILEEKDILVSIAGTIGRISYISDVYNGVNINQAIAFIRLKDSRKYFNFLLYYMKSSVFQNEMSSKVVQAVQANVSLSVIKTIRLVLPNDNNLKKYNEVIQPIVVKIEMLRNENETLIGIRDSLLPKLFSGEIELPIEEE